MHSDGMRAAAGIAAVLRLPAAPAAADADCWLAGVQADLGIVHLRYNLSRAEYGPAAETLRKPGVTVDLTAPIGVLLEYVDRTRDRDGGPDGRLDRSPGAVLWVEF